MKFGLRNAITVRKVVRQGVYWDTTLVAGLHRLEAVRLLEHKSILATVITADDTDARLWEISENLHRAELTKLERNEQIAEWIKLTEAKEVSAQVEPKPQCGRPKSGVRAAARELGVDRNEAQRSIKIAEITDEAKDAAREAGLDDNQSALLKVAAEPVEKQVEAVEQIVKAKAAAKTRPKTKTVTTAQHAQRRASAMHALSVFKSKAKAEKPKQASEPVTITLSTAEYKVAADVAALETIATRASNSCRTVWGDRADPRLLVGRRRARVLEDGHELPDRPAGRQGRGMKRPQNEKHPVVAVDRLPMRRCLIRWSSGREAIVDRVSDDAFEWLRNLLLGPTKAA